MDILNRLVARRRGEMSGNEGTSEIIGPNARENL